MQHIEPFQRPAPLNQGSERDQLNSWLDYYRNTLLIKCTGLDIDQLRRRAVPPSNLSLLGLLRHMTVVEQVWFESTFANFAAPTHYVSDADQNADFNDLNGVGLDEVVENFLTVCQRSRELADGHSLDETVASPRRGRDVDLRWIHLHMIEEYARHCGHADLLREVIDGQTGS